jgi:hypothetical protein
LLKAVANGAACVTLLLLISTGNSLYGATTLVGPSNSERLVTVHVESCHRVGPVSTSGFGFWWTCQVTLAGAGDPATATIRRSIVTQEDVGHDVTVLRHCEDYGCFYGHKVSQWWEIPMVMLFLGGSALAMMAVCFTIRFLFLAVFPSW